MFCGADNKLFLRLVTQTAVIEVLSISGDGKTLTHFEKSKINDVPNPRFGTFFVAGGDVYVQTTGFADQETGTMLVPRRDGTTASERTVRYKGARTYLAHFKSDGSYDRAVPLDLDFRMLRFGVFPSGEILVTGIKDESQQPRVALLSSNGQLLRYLEPEGDVQADAPQFGDAASQHNSPLMPPETFLRVIISSTIIPEGDRLLMVRPGSDPRVFAVTNGGGIARKKLEIPRRSSLFGLIATPTGWIGEVSEPAGARGMKLMLFSFDRETGAAKYEYQYPGPFGLGLACSDGNDFLFLREELSESFALVRAQPGTSEAKPGPSLK
jgi:hypothetical protein